MLYKQAEQVTDAAVLSGAASYWGTDYTLSVVSDHIRLSTREGAATTADRAWPGWPLARLAVRGPSPLPVHIGATLLGSPTSAHPGFVAIEPLLALAEDTGSEISWLRPWRSREARLLGEALGTADQHREEFVAVLSHDFRSPLAAIRNAAHLVGNPATEAQARDKAQALLERQLERVIHLVDDLLDMSRLALGRVLLKRERIDLRIAVSNAIETLEPDIQQRHHRLTVALPSSPVWLQGDGRRLEEVFVNLLANACKFTDAGGELAVRLHASGGQAMVQVRDSGIGIDAHSLPCIFDPFKRVDEGAAHPEAGLGIGLALVREFIKLHGGSVMARSAGRGHGSEFAVQLPTEG